MSVMKTKKKIRVVHFSYTPLAGSPVRIVSALNSHTEVEARLINFNPNAYSTRTFEEDLSWQNDKDEALRIIEDADVLHLHNWIDLKNNKFEIDFSALQKRGKALIRQFHTNPKKLAENIGIGEEEILHDDLPQLVLAQFHERFYPKARIVPNIVPIFDPRYMPAQKSSLNDDCFKIFFAPTSMRNAWSSRWDTKGAYETIKILNSLKKSDNVSVELSLKTPHDETLRKKRFCNLVIDETVTGSYHLSTLEGLSMGKPTIAFLDQRTLQTLQFLTGDVMQIPIINCQIEHLKPIVKRLINNKSMCEDIAAASREWVEKHWNDAKLVEHYVRAYEDLINNPESFQLKRFNENDGKNWLFLGLMDDIWLARKNQWKKLHRDFFGFNKILNFFKKLKLSITSKIRR